MTVSHFDARNASILKMIRENLKQDWQDLFGVIAPIEPRVENFEAMRDLALGTAGHMPFRYLGIATDCGCSPFCDDSPASRKTAIATIRMRVQGRTLATQVSEDR